MGVDFGEGSFIPTLFRVSRTTHSEKPSMFYEILRIRTKEPRIDIFARKRHFGFDAYGDQVETEMEVPIMLFISEIEKK
jgi:N6-adenosine-specific RNA methylase IME4